MSKVSQTSATEYPSFASGSVSINDRPIASTTYQNGKINSNYMMTDSEKAIYDYAQSTLASILPQLNVFSPETTKSLQNQLDAYKSQGTKTINDIYYPMIKNLENDIASRFGNFDNSIFMDNLKGIESKRGDAINSFVQDLIAKQSDLEAQELKKRYTYADFLNNMQNQTLQNALSVINTALGSSSNANSYNNNLYNSLYKQYLQSQSGLTNNGSLLASALGLTSGTTTL